MAELIHRGLRFQDCVIPEENNAITWKAFKPAEEQECEGLVPASVFFHGSGAGLAALFAERAASQFGAASLAEETVARVTDDHCSLVRKEPPTHHAEIRFPVSAGKTRMKAMQMGLALASTYTPRQARP